jgi:hypothetical protein
MLVGLITKFHCTAECGEGPVTRFCKVENLDSHSCPACGAKSVRESRSIKPPGMDYDQPILSDALGVHPSQIREAQQRFPDHKFTPDGRMILESHQKRERVLKQLGYHDKN